MVNSISLAIVTFPSLIVAVHSFIISYNTPQQCGDVKISWTNPSTSAAQLQFPLLLHVLPFNSIAISQQIHGWNASMTSGSAIVHFRLNLASGTSFLLAVTDQIGQGVGLVSDVKNVATSQDVSCLSENTTPSPAHFQTFTTPSPSDCPSITVRWDNTVKSLHPTILGFSPGQSPVDMDPPLSPLPMGRSVSMTGIFTSMSRVVVLFCDSSSGPNWTSQLLTVGGTDKDGCGDPSAIRAGTSPPATTTTNPCNFQCSADDSGRVIGGALAGVVGFAILLYVVFACSRWRHRAKRGPQSDPEDVSTAKSSSLTPHPSKAAILDDSRSIHPSMTPTSTESNGPTDETEPNQVQEQENQRISTTRPSSISHSLPLSLPPSPLTRRRSWTSRSIHSLLTEESNFLQFSEASNVRLSQPRKTDSITPTIRADDEGGIVSRPDSPTLPESSKSLPPTPKTPRTPKTAKISRPRSQRSQRSERRETYLRLDPTSEITISVGDVFPEAWQVERPWSQRDKILTDLANRP